MLSPDSRQPSAQPLRSALSGLLVLAVSFALVACDGAENPLSPADEALTPGTEPTPAAVVEPGNAPALITAERILFLSYRFSDQPDLYKMNPQGTQIAHLSAKLENESDATWSYDNNRIAVVRRRVSGAVSRDDIYLMNADGTTGHWARANPIAYALQDPSWSPNGSHLLVRVWVQNVTYLGRMDAATGMISFIYNESAAGIPGRQASYDKTGQRIIYVGKDSKTIEQINANGSGRKIRYTSTTTVAHPSFSPDGQKIAFSRYVGVGTNTEIYVKNLVDGTVKRLTYAADSDMHPSWSPDGTKIAFTSERSGKQQIWTMNSTTGGSLVRLTQTQTPETNPAWSH